MKSLSLYAVGSMVGLTAADILWDGRFNDLTSAEDLNKWSFANEVGPYQYYIHGSGAVSEYVELSPADKNPADSGSEKGVKITLTNTAYWNGQNMRRTELIPQTSAPINQGKVFYHFSIKRSDTNAPSINREHQIAFFESHFTELKSGWISGAAGTEDVHLRWDIGGQTQWMVEWDADVWHNCAYEIDFSGNTVGFWHSTGADPLVQTVAPMSSSTSSNGADWHLGVLELPRDGYPDSTEDFYFSGVYVEDGSITTSVAGPGGVVVNPPSNPTTTTAVKTTMSTSVVAPPTTTKKTTTMAPPPATTTKPPAAGGASHYAQCGGSGWSGATGCVAPYACSTLNPYYYQCL